MSRSLVVAATVAFLAPIGGAVAYLASTEAPAHAAPVAAPRPAAVQSAKAGPAAPVPKPPAGVSYEGETSQELAISFEVARDGRTIQDLRITYAADCDAFDFELDDKFFTPVAVKPDGTFSVEGVGNRLTFNGRVADGKASGNVRVDYMYGGMFECRTPKLRWNASTA